MAITVNMILPVIFANPSLVLLVAKQCNSSRSVTHGAAADSFFCHDGKNGKGAIAQYYIGRDAFALAH